MSIIAENVSYTYSKKTPYEKAALNNVSFTIEEGQCVGVVGCTGSGKSTLIQHLNGLIKLQSGKIKVLDIDLNAKKVDFKLLRKGIGMLFQYPEYQLFAETVLSDVMFGPLNFGMSKEEALASAKEAITMAGLDFEDINNRSPLEISGGQKRRVAIAGVLAYRPQILILDEPTAGLDPRGKKEILDLIASLKKSYIKTVIIVSHNMDEIAKYTQRVLVLKNGELLYDTTPNDLFYNKNIEELGLALPHAVNIVKLLHNKGISLPKNILSKEELFIALSNYLGRAK
ncbi:energy-coupling factor transporter ATPase [bacterium]|nr:energy-coupling factor transporter ATPase [bacterium]